MSIVILFYFYFSGKRNHKRYKTTGPCKEKSDIFNNYIKSSTYAGRGSRFSYVSTRGVRIIGKVDLLVARWSLIR